jgi:hypothetical protein
MDEFRRLRWARNGLARRPRRHEGMLHETQAEDDGAEDRHQVPAGSQDQIAAILIGLVGDDRNAEAESDQSADRGVLDGRRQIEPARDSGAFGRARRDGRSVHGRSS